MTDDEMALLMAGSPSPPKKALTDDEMAALMKQTEPRPAPPRTAPVSPAVPDPSLWGAVKDLAKERGARMADLAGQAEHAFADFGSGVANAVGGANRAIGNAVVHPVDTARSLAANPAAAARQFARGVNDNIPYANRLVSKLPGGAPETSPEDQAAFPNARQLGNVAGLPVADAGGQLAGRALKAGGEAATGMMARRAADDVYKSIGKAAPVPTKARLMKLGPEALADVDREFQISSSPNPAQAIQAANARVGAARDQAFNAISAAGGDVSMDTVTRRLDNLQTEFASRAGTRPFASDVARLRSDLLQQYGTTGKISSKALTDEIGAIEDGAYGDYKNPKTSKRVQRRTAGALREVHDQHLDAVAQLGPDESNAVQALRDANRKFSVLKTIEPTVKAQTVNAEFAPGIVDRAIDHGPVKAGLHVAKDAAVGGAKRAISGAGQAASAVGDALAPPDAPAIAPGNPLIRAAQMDSARQRAGRGMLLREAATAGQQ